MEWHNTAFARSRQLSVHKLFTSCIRRCLVSRSCDWVMSPLSAALLIFSLQFSLLFINVSVTRPHQHCVVLFVLISHIGHRTLPKIWVGTFLVRDIDFELILTVTRPAAVYLGTHCNIGSKRALPTGVLDGWHNCYLFTDATSHSVPRPHRFVYFCVMTQQNVNGSDRRNCFFVL